MPYLFQKRGIRVIYKGSIFVQKSIAVNPQRICKCHRYIVLNGVSVILIQNQCRGHNANLFCQFPCGETLECPVILQILARCGAFFIGFVVKGQMNHDFAFRIEVNPCVIEITIGKPSRTYYERELFDNFLESEEEAKDRWAQLSHRYPGEKPVITAEALLYKYTAVKNACLRMLTSTREFYFAYEYKSIIDYIATHEDVTLAFRSECDDMPLLPDGYQDGSEHGYYGDFYC